MLSPTVALLSLSVSGCAATAKATFFFRLSAAASLLSASVTLVPRATAAVCRACISRIFARRQDRNTHTSPCPVWFFLRQYSNSPAGSAHGGSRRPWKNGGGRSRTSAPGLPAFFVVPALPGRIPAPLRRPYFSASPLPASSAVSGAASGSAPSSSGRASSSSASSVPAALPSSTAEDSGVLSTTGARKLMAERRSEMREALMVSLSASSSSLASAELQWILPPRWRPAPGRGRWHWPRCSGFR